MPLLALIRHGPTTWNALRRIQGQTDVPLSERGRAAVAGWRVPDELAGCRWVVSPLQRALETAQLLGLGSPPREPALMEMHWGAWQGENLAELRRRLGAEMRRNEARGLDFQPPGGESRRMLQQRLHAWFRRAAATGQPTAAVTHKGVVHATLALACGWDMSGKPPVRLRWDCAHLFMLDASGLPRVERVNVPLAMAARDQSVDL